MPSRRNAAGYVPEESDLEYEVTTDGVKRRFWKVLTRYKEEEAPSVQHPPRELYEPKHAFRDALRAFRPPLPVLPREQRCANSGLSKNRSKVGYAPFPYDVQPWESTVYHRKRITEDRIERLEEVDFSYSSRTSEESFDTHRERAIAELRKMQRYVAELCSRRRSSEAVDFGSELDSSNVIQKAKTGRRHCQKGEVPGKVTESARGLSTSTVPSKTPTLSQVSSWSHLQYPSYPSSLICKPGPATPHSTPPLSVKGVRRPTKENRKPSIPSQSVLENEYIEVSLKDCYGIPGPSKITDKDEIVAHHLAKHGVMPPSDEKAKEPSKADLEEISPLDDPPISSPLCLTPRSYPGKGKGRAPPPMTQPLPPEMRYLPQPKENEPGVPTFDDLSWVDIKNEPPYLRPENIIRTAGLELRSAVAVSEAEKSESVTVIAQTDDDDAVYEDAVEDGDEGRDEPVPLPHKRIDSAVSPPVEINN